MGPSVWQLDESAIVVAHVHLYLESWRAGSVFIEGGPQALLVGQRPLAVSGSLETYQCGDSSGVLDCGEYILGFSVRGASMVFANSSETFRSVLGEGKETLCVSLIL